MQRERAIALQYDEEDSIPRVLASGAGEVARQILRIAAEHDIPVHQDEALSQLLSNLPQGARVPPETYELIAEVVCFLYGIEREVTAQQANPLP